MQIAKDCINLLGMLTAWGAAGNHSHQTRLVQPFTFNYKNFSLLSYLEQLIFKVNLQFGQSPIEEYNRRRCQYQPTRKANMYRRWVQGQENKSQEPAR